MITTVEKFFRHIPLLAPLVDFEQRLHQRYPSKNARVKIKGIEGHCTTGVLKDISRTGLAFQIAAFIPKEAVILDIFEQERPISEHIPCRIMWRKEKKAGTILYGVQFQDLNSEQTRQIDEFVNTETVGYTYKFFHGWHYK